jgi:hypothetical protein
MGYLGQSGLGAIGGGQASIRDALARLLATLESLPAAFADKKFLPSNDATMLEDAPELRSIMSPTLWEGSNVVAWPVGDWNALEAAWDAAIAALGITSGDLRAFALQRKLATATSTRASALDATRNLIAQYDAKFGGGEGIPWWMWLAAAAAVGAVYVSSQPAKKGGKPKARKPRKRLFKRRVTRTYY